MESSTSKSVELLWVEFIGLTLANAFLVHYETNWLQNCLPDFRFYYYPRYVDDIFVLFISPRHLKAFREFLNGQHANISFTIESETQNRFLMCRLFRKIKHLQLLFTINLPLVIVIRNGKIVWKYGPST